MAIELAKRGVDLIVTYLSNDAAAKEIVAKVQALGRKAAALQLDVANSKSFADFVAQVTATSQGDLCCGSLRLSREQRRHGRSSSDREHHRGAV
jgi:NAD(P)-dependent dehydrogenase (short-subunit alcohol dehydrogenase family)